jgi:CheY-like chemotaxis protein
MTPTQDDYGPRAQLHVLLAEDSLVQQKLATILLRKQGHTVKLASNGKEAVDAFEDEHFDLVLMDIEMPVMDGLDATSLIREREGRIGRHTPVVAVTSTTDQERCFAVGMDAYIAKPLSPDVLSATMEQVLGI